MSFELPDPRRDEDAANICPRFASSDTQIAASADSLGAGSGTAPGATPDEGLVTPARSQERPAAKVTITVDETDPWESLLVTADPAELRQRYERELREDEMYDAPDDKLIKHVYEQNPDAPELEVEDEWG